MISCEDLYQIMRKNDLTFFTGIPDSTFKGWINFLDKNYGKNLTNIIAANECEAIALASGYNLSSGKIGVVYMQNSGLGKTVNPLTSLCDPEVYSIPLLMMIGWRGEPKTKDEPQHKKMGKITLPLLDTLEIEYEILPSNKEDIEKIISIATDYMKNNNRPYALIIRKGIVEEHHQNKQPIKKFELTREEAIKCIVDSLDDKSLIISTTGKTSRELFEYRLTKSDKPKDFYTIGSMGCSSSIALGIALQKPNKKIIVFDGDGAAIMQMGAFATIGHYKPRNFYHIIFDNNSYDSTGGQPTVSNSINFEKIALACGYASANTVKSKNDLNNILNNIPKLATPSLILVKTNQNSRKNLGRPNILPLENKKSFMQSLE